MASLVLVCEEQGMGTYAAYYFEVFPALRALCTRWEVYWGFVIGIDVVWEGRHVFRQKTESEIVRRPA
jgi:hypothetical protein